MTLAEPGEVVLGIVADAAASVAGPAAVVVDGAATVAGPSAVADAGATKVHVSGMADTAAGATGPATVADDVDLDSELSLTK